MLIGLFFSRAILSSALIVFILANLIQRNFLHQLKIFFASPVLWSMSLLFFLPFISGLWSEDIHQWADIARIKLPLLLLPLCFAGMNDLSFRDWKRIALCFLLLAFVAVCWSLWQYFRDTSSIHAAYLKAQTINTPLENDHVRFSLLITIAIFTALFLLIKEWKTYKRGFIFLLIATGMIFILYLHVLAVRTGLICFYLGLFIFFVWLLFKERNVKFVLLFGLILLLPVAAYFIFPTFKNRIKYFKYDLSLVQKNIYRPGSNDGNRIKSMQAGWQLMNQHAFSGVGFGDIKNETDKIYEINYSAVSQSDKILPSSEWMIYGAGTGWPGFIFFTLIMTIPFFIDELGKNIFWTLINVFISLSYLFDIGLEVQFGVFIHAFVLLWWYKWLQSEP
jgi:hypothetical protein